MSNLNIKYTFQYIDNCNMCGESTKKSKILGKRLNKSQGKNPKKKIGITTTICKCKKCGLIFSNPMPIPFNIQYHYGMFPEDYWVKEYFILPENYFIDEFNILKKLLNFQAGMNSLDIGAGLGKQMIALEKFGFEVYGIEPSASFHSRAINQMNINPAKLKLGMIEEIEYPENYFDFISFGAVLEHQYNPSASIQKSLNWLKPGGIIHIEVPSSKWLISRLMNLFYKLKCNDYVSNLSPMHEPYHLYEFSLDSFCNHAKLNNYKIAFHQYYVCQTYLPKFINSFMKPIMKKTNSGMQLCVWLRKK